MIEYNTSVVVPDLGCFSIIHMPSRIQDGIVIPPVKTVKFDSEKTEDDNVFTLYMAKKEDITLEQAVKEVKNFYNYFFINRLVKERRPITFEKFGTFSIDEAGNICFEPITDFFKDNFGLGSAQISQPPPTPAKPVVPIPAPPKQIIKEPELVKPIVPEPKTEPVMPKPAVPELPQPEPPKPEPTPTVSQPTPADANENRRFRENTERRRPAVEKPEPQKQSPPPTKTTSKKPKKAGKRSSRWILLGLLVAVLVVGGYFAYPIILPHIQSIIDRGDREQATIPMFTEDTDVAVADTLYSEFPPLDDETDRRNLLNPDVNQPATPPTTPAPSQAAPAPQTQAQPISSSVVSGNFLIIVGSLPTRAEAERQLNMMQRRAAGHSFEIIDAGNNRFRISAGSFNDLAEAQRQMEQIRTQPWCPRDIWIWTTRR